MNWQKQQIQIIYNQQNKYFPLEEATHRQAFQLRKCPNSPAPAQRLQL